jgi:hypothetical protein
LSTAAKAYIEESESNKIDIGNRIKGEASRMEEKSIFVDNNPSANTFYVNFIKLKNFANENNGIGKVQFDSMKVMLMLILISSFYFFSILEMFWIWIVKLKVA